MNIFKRVNELAQEVFAQLGRKVVGIRVFYNSLLLYFDNGQVRFWSKRGLDWGEPDSIYFVTMWFDPSTLSKRLHEQFSDIIDWTTKWVNANLIEKLMLLIEYIVKYAGRLAFV